MLHRCGDCQFWMCSHDCPIETRVKPSADYIANCSKFIEKPWVAMHRKEQAEKESRERLEQVRGDLETIAFFNQYF